MTDNILSQVRFRTVRPTDLTSCAALERLAYPEDEAASKSTLQYRQHHAARYFRCAVVGDDNDDDDQVIGYICATRCRDLTAESMTTHVAEGSILAIHSVVVDERYRRQGIATAMLKNYMEKITTMNEELPTPIVTMQALAKAHLLTFYVGAGFSVKRPSPVVHGSEQWYEIEYDLSMASKKAGLPCYIVDAFADPEQSFTGNPAAVVVLGQNANLNDEALSTWMQTTAAEFNLSETAFLVPRHSANDKELHYGIRYYTPTSEVPLCGHATLASAAIIYQTTRASPEVSLVLHAKEDELRADLSSSSSSALGRGRARIAMTFPTKRATPIEETRPCQEMMKKALNIDPECIEYVAVSEEMGDVLVVVSYESFLEIGYDALNYEALLEWDGYRRGVIVCALSSSSCSSSSASAAPSSVDSVDDNESVNTTSSHLAIDFLVRFFGPKVGVKEDPVTGSACCLTAPYFGDRLGKDKVTGMQMSRRGGILECLLQRDDDNDEKVTVTGTAVTAVSGTLWL